MKSVIKIFALLAVIVVLIVGGMYFYPKNSSEVVSVVKDDVVTQSVDSVDTIPNVPAQTPSTVIPDPVIVQKKMKENPKGYFLLADRKSTISTLQPLMSKVDGIVIITSWKDIEPQKGVYDFSSIDQRLDMATAAGKQATLAVFTGKNSWPTWIVAEGVRTWKDAKGNELIHPTDKTFVKLWGERVAKLGARYDGNQTIRQVAICGAAGTLCGPRYPELPKDAPFDDIKSAWSDVVDVYVQAFPNTLKHLEVHLTVGHDAELGSYLLRQTDGGVGIFAEFLSDVNPPASSPVIQVIKSFPAKWCGFQMVSPLRDKLQAAIVHGSSFGCDYFEIYQGDVANNYLQ